jgi:outer membrane protein OmpA-like peptidoglycan-associated protein
MPIGCLSVIPSMTSRILACACFLAVSMTAQTAATSSSNARRSTVKSVESKDIKLGEDEAGCKDSILLPRIPGCSIIQCDSKEEDTVELQVGVSTDGVVQKESMDGASEVIYYLCPAKASLAGIVKTSDAALLKGGFKAAFNGKDDDEHPIVTAFKETQWVQISTYMYNEYSAYIVSAIKVDEESQAPAEALAEEMSKSGRVTLAGLQFADEKSDLPTDAEKLMAEVAALLVRQPNWKVCVEAHGAQNGLLQKRAAAVATWLLDHGIDKTRVSIQGVAAAEAGQRIDLVRF